MKNKLIKSLGKLPFKLIIFANLLIILDQLTKYFARTKLQTSLPLIKNIFHLTPTTNTGIVFGLFQNANLFFIFTTIIIITLMFYFFKYFKEQKITFTFIIAGAFSNLIDRIFLGHVFDFIDFRIWPIFNLADAFISISIIYLIIINLKKS